jgi:hypothetical protein
MAKVTDTNFLTIEGWMRTALNLSGNELIVFAVIYQFSQGKAGRYIGGLPYLADWCGCHPDTARRAIRELEERGLIEALRGEVNGVPYCNYIVCEASLQNARVSPQNATDTPANCEDYPRKMQGINISRTINKTIREDKINNIRFTPPTFEEVRAYCLERGNAIDPAQFIDYYTANGWKVGRNPMRDWRAAVRQWEARRKTETPYPQSPSPRGKESVYEKNARAFEEFQRRIKLQYADEQ